jgi:hypothetical protein
VSEGKSSRRFESYCLRVQEISRKTKGRLAEAKVLTYLIENEYEVYTPFSDNSKCDLLAIKDKVVYRISVKYTSTQGPYGNWIVGLRNTSRRNNGEVKVDLFDRSSYDILAVYIGPKDEVRIVDVNSFKGTSNVNIKY